MDVFYFLSLLLFILPIVQTASSPHSNINSIASLTLRHNFGDSNKVELRDEEYDFCIRTLLKQTPKGEIFGPFHKFAIEFTPTSLPCSPCRYSTQVNVTWTKLSFENEVIRLIANEELQIGNDDTLVFKKPKPSDFGTYFCTVNGFVANIWSVEVEPFKYFDILKPRHWKKHSTNLRQMKISTAWEPWSHCNQCGEHVGKRYRLGYCFVEPLESNADELSYKALQLYKQGLSCNLFLLLHPDVDPETIEILESKPVLLIGYCKIPCDYLDTSPEILFSRVHPQIQRVYQNQLEMRADLEIEKVREQNRGKRGLIPGKPTVFEGLVLFLLVSLQIVILVHICRNRTRAK